MAFDLKENFRARGIKTSVRATKKVNFVGSKANLTFRQMLERQKAKFVGPNTDVATLGEAYESGAYKKPGSSQKEYEPIFDGTDWTAAPVDTKELLDEIFGNNDNAAEAVDVSQAELTEFHGLNVSVPNDRSIIELQAELTSSQQISSAPRDEDTAGIRGVDDPESRINPII